MDNIDKIAYAAVSEAKFNAPLRYDPDDQVKDDVYSDVYLKVVKVSDKKKEYDVSFVNHEKHDNAPRAPFIANFVKRVLRDTDNSLDCTGIYPFELHDSYTYLPERRRSTESFMTFSKHHADRNPVLFPDPFQLSSYGNLLAVKDNVPREKKLSRILFAGSTTGDRDPAKNVRINACLWSLKKDNCDFYITNVAQMSPDVVPKSILHDPVTIEEHFKYKYILNIRGNTCCWSRMPMIMNSSSLLVNLAHDDITWYYPLMGDNAGVNINRLDQLDSVVNFCTNNDREVHMMTMNANKFVQNYCKLLHAEHYTKTLFDTFAHNK
jgi:hypothetical protein